MTNKGFSCELIQQRFASNIILGRFNHGEWTAFTKSINYESQVLYNGSYSFHSQTDSMRAARPMACSWVECFAQGHFQMLSGRAGKYRLNSVVCNQHGRAAGGVGVLSKA